MKNINECLDTINDPPVSSDFVNDIEKRLKIGEPVSLKDFLRAINNSSLMYPIHSNSLVKWIKQDLIVIATDGTNVVALPQDQEKTINIFNKLSQNGNKIEDLKQNISDTPVNIQICAHGTNSYVYNYYKTLKRINDQNENGKNKTILFFPTNMVKNSFASTKAGCFKRSELQQNIINIIIRELIETKPTIECYGNSYGNLMSAIMARKIIRDIPGAKIGSLNLENIGGDFFNFEKVNDIYDVLNEMNDSEARKIEKINVDHKLYKPQIFASSLFHPIRQVQKFFELIKKTDKFKIIKTVEVKNGLERTLYVPTFSPKKEHDHCGVKGNTKKNINEHNRPEPSLCVLLLLSVFTLFIGTYIYIVVYEHRLKKYYKTQPIINKVDNEYLDKKIQQLPHGIV